MLRRLRAMLRWLWAVKLKIEATLACAEFSAMAGLRLTTTELVRWLKQNKREAAGVLILLQSKVIMRLGKVNELRQ